MSDCEMSTHSNCTWDGLDRDQFYTPVQLIGPKIDNPDHLFNLIHNPLEDNCTYARLVYSKEMMFMLSEQCRNF